MLTADDLADFVTWPGLELAMRGLKDMLDNTAHSVNIINQRRTSIPMILPPIAQTSSQIVSLDY